MRAPGQRGEAVHRALDDRRRRQIEAVHGFAAWKKTSGFCAEPRSTGWSGDSARARVRRDEPLVDHRAEIVVAERLDLLQLV